MVHNFKDFPELTNNQMTIYYFESPHKQITDDFTARVVKVTDGDTIKVEWRDRDFNFPIRFANIAAPESKEAGGIESRDWLANRILGKEVEVVIDNKNRVGKWGRLLGLIMEGGQDIGEESIFMGHSVEWGARSEGKIPDIGKKLEENEWLS